MPKRFIVIFIAFLLPVIVLAGCGDSNNSEELTGVFSGTAGTLEFLSDGEIKVDFADQYVWMIMAGSNNHATHGYRFVTKDNKKASYLEAEYININKIGGALIISNPCKVTDDQIILYPDSINEVVLDRTN